MAVPKGICYNSLVFNLNQEKGTAMAIIPQKSLFSWKNIESASDLDRLSMVLRVIPDEALMKCLEKERDKGRDDYPVRAVWNSILAGIIFQHVSVASLRRELSRNGQLRQLCGFDPVKGSSAIPPAWGYTRFLSRLFGHQEAIEEMFNTLVDQLEKHLKGFGENLAIDSKAISSLSKANKKGKEKKEDEGDKKEQEGKEGKGDKEDKENKGNKEEQEEQEEKEKEDRRKEQDADYGTKRYKGKRKDGSLWEKVITWFGFKLHLIVDADYELPVAYEVTRASRSDSRRLIPMVEGLKRRHPELVEGARHLMGDKGYDASGNNKILLEEYGIKPVIDTRAMWKGEKGEKRLYYEDGRIDNILFDERGGLHCVFPSRHDPLVLETASMAFCGYEKDRGTLKYRCPAVAYGISCPLKGTGQCGGKGVGAYGRIVRAPLDKDRRMFVPVVRDSPKWKRLYNKRTSVERVNSRLDCSFGFERHYIRGLKKMRLQVSLALIVMLSMALSSIKEGRQENMRSLVAPFRLEKAA